MESSAPVVREKVDRDIPAGSKGPNLVEIRFLGLGRAQRKPDKASFVLLRAKVSKSPP